MSAPENTHLRQSAVVGSLSSQIVALQDENKRLRAALADCGTAVGGIVAPQCSLDFLECVSQEVRLVTERLRRERAALQVFHAFFADRCEGLFMQFGMPAVDAYNAAALAMRKP